MKKNIVIVAGGDSSEVIVSLKSAEGIYSFLDKEKYNVYIALVKKGEWAVKLPNGEYTPIDKNDFSFHEDGQVRHFDFAYITIHGTPGEDGRLQGYFDMIEMPYSSCGMFVSALTFNKYACNHYLKDFGVKIAESIHLFKGQTVAEEEVLNRLGLPVFVKPNDGGSSFGVTKVKELSALQPAIAKAFEEGKEVEKISRMQQNDDIMGQTNLFASITSDAERIIRQTDVETLTPIEALNLLYELKSIVK